VVPAHGSWAAGLPTGGAGRAAVVAVTEGTTHLLISEGKGSLVLRRLPAGDWEEIAESCGSGPGVASVLAPPSVRAELTGSLSRRGWTVVTDSDRGPTAEEASARGASKSEIELEPPSLIRERSEAGKRLAGRFVGVAALVLVAAAGLHLWGARRALDAVRGERAAISESVGPLILAQDSLNRLNEQIETITGLTDQSPTWTLALVDLALNLPPQSYLTGLNASGDTIEIEAAGERAGEALEALRAAPNLWDVRLLERIDRTLENGETVIERYRVQARLVNPNGEVASADPGAATLEEMVRARIGGGGP